MVRRRRDIFLPIGNADAGPIVDRRPGVTATVYRVSSTDEQETALSAQTVLDHDDMHHLVNGLSLEVARQAERIRHHSHGQDWPGAASAMSELEEAVEILGRLVNVTLRHSIGPAEPAPEREDESPPAELAVGQYL